MKWIKNTGQFAPQVAWVLNATGTILEPFYSGAGVVELVGEFGNLSEIRYLGRAAWSDSLDAYVYDASDGTKIVIEDGDDEFDVLDALAQAPHLHFAVASAGEIVVPHGTGTAAALNLLAGDN